MLKMPFGEVISGQVAYTSLFNDSLLLAGAAPARNNSGSIGPVIYGVRMCLDRHSHPFRYQKYFRS